MLHLFVKIQTNCQASITGLFPKLMSKKCLARYAGLIYGLGLFEGRVQVIRSVWMMADGQKGVDKGWRWIGESEANIWVKRHATPLEWKK